MEARTMDVNQHRLVEPQVGSVSIPYGFERGTSIKSWLLRSRTIGKHPVLAWEVTGVASGVSQQVVLVLGLGFPEISSRFNFSHYFSRP